MAADNISSIGRFSSQMLTYLGTQRTVKVVSGSIANSFKYATGPTVYPSPGSVSQAALGAGVIGNYSNNTYNATKCYFLSRGASNVYSDAMTGLAIDIAAMMNVSTANLLVKSDLIGKTLFSEDAFTEFNKLRNSGNQVGMAATVNNKNSIQSKQIRS